MDGYSEAAQPLGSRAWLQIILVGLGCPHKYHRHEFLTVREAGVPGFQRGWVLMRTFWWVSDKLLLAVSSRGSKRVSSLYYKKGFQSHFWGPHPQDLLKSPPPNTITIGVRFQHVNFERTYILSLQQREHMKERNTRRKNRGEEKKETEPSDL